MIEPNKLWQLDGGQRRRKLALTFGALERDIAGIAEAGTTVTSMGASMGLGNPAAIAVSTGRRS